MFTKIGAWIAAVAAVFNFGGAKPQEVEPTWAQPGYIEMEHIETENIEIENVQRERYEGELYIIEDAPVAIADKVVFGDNVETWDNSPNISRWE
jgi:hypothetical protein